MKKALLAATFASLAASPTMAGTSFPFTCTGEGDVFIELGLFAEGGGTVSSYDGTPTPILWYEQEGVTIVVLEENPSVFVVSFSSETGDAMVPFEPGSLMPAHCRFGGE